MITFHISGSVDSVLYVRCKETLCQGLCDANRNNPDSPKKIRLHWLEREISYDIIHLLPGSIDIKLAL